MNGVTSSLFYASHRFGKSGYLKLSKYYFNSVVN